MINLIKNELTKIFSKKTIYIYSIIAFSLIIGISIISKNTNENNDNNISTSYAETLEENLHTYDLTNKDELNMYIGDRVIIDTNRLTRNYRYDDPEYYYIDNIIEPLVYEKYTLEYKEKNPEKAQEIQIKIDEEVKKLTNFDWKKVLTDEKALLANEIKYYENILIENSSNDTIKLQLEDAELRLWCLNYRIEHNIPYSYNSKSNLIDSYYDFAVQYKSLVKDESKIKDKNELIKKRQTEANYKTALYKLENNLISKNQDMIDYIVASMAYIDGFIVIAIIIICGSIISEEFNKGTIKQLLIKPFSRGKILTSKIIASLLAISIFVVLYETIFILANCYEYSDFSSIFGTNIIYDFNIGKIKEVSILGQCLYGFISVLPAYLIIFAIVLFVGALSTSTAASMCTGFGIFMFYDLLSLWLNEKILSYIPFYTWDLTPYMYGGLSTNQYASFGKSLLIDVLTIILFVILSYIVFKRKDIKNQ